MNESKNYLIQGGKVITPAGTKTCDVLVANGRIAKIAEGIQDPNAEIVDARGMYVAPGLVDIHCRLREPGYDEKETIASGTAAAAKGGFSTVCCLAGTDPINDNAVVTAYIKRKAEMTGPVHVHPIAALTKGLKGEELTEVGELSEAGAVALSDAAKSIKNANRLRLALSYGRRFGLPIIVHAEDEELTNGGLMNEGYWSTALGLAGATRAAEESIVARDCMLAEIEDAPIHIANVSTRGSLEIVRAMKRRGVKVTCGTAPHYVYATDEWIGDYDTNTKVNPPLRTEDDRNALIEGLKDGTVDCIATDHAPQHLDDKNVEYAIAAYGISGLETALGICWTALVVPGHLTPEQLFEKLSAAPARILNLPAGTLEESAPADIAVIAPDATWTVDPAAFVSKGCNTPFGGRTLTGAVKCTLAGGIVAYRDEKDVQ